MDAKAWQMYLNALKGNFKKLARIDFLQPDGTVAFSIDNKEAGRRNRTFIQDGSLTVNLQNGKRRVASIKLSNAGHDYDYSVNKLWFGQQIRLMEGLELPDGEEFYLPQGVFYVANPEEAFEPKGSTVTLNLQDKWAYLDGTLFGRLDGIYEVPLGTNIFAAIQSVLDLPRENGWPVDTETPVFTEYYNGQTTELPDGTEISDLLTPYTYRCESDDGTYADIILEMNNIVAGWIGYDSTGRLRLDPSQDDITDADKPILWEFTPNEQQFLGATYTVKNTEVYNDVIITGEGLTEYSYVAGRACNFDPSSDTNINLIGRKTYRESAAGYATNKQCENLAVFKLKRQTILQKSVTIQSTQIFHLSENNLVTIYRPDKKGQPIERHLITGFTRPIAQTGKMTIQATSVQDIAIATTIPVTKAGPQCPLCPSKYLVPSKTLVPCGAEENEEESEGNE